MNQDSKFDESAEQVKDTEFVVNEYGAVKDSAVVIEEETRTVLLTDNETIIIDKPVRMDIAGKNRPRKVYAGMWGNTEIATVGLGILALLATIILFMFVVMPAKKDLEDVNKKRDNLETELTAAKNKYGKITTTEARVAELVNSATDFETRFLPIASNGRTALYQRINGLISSYKLINTSGPSFTPLEISSETKGQQPEAERGKSKFQSLFPGDYVTTTVEGSYQNLRRFIREVETSNQFIVISAIELQPAENEEQKKINDGTQPQINNVQVTPNGLPTGFPQNPNFEKTAAQPQSEKQVRGKTRGETVSLRLEMAAYFRRPVIQPTETGSN